MHSMFDRSDSSSGSSAHTRKVRPPPSATIYITPPPQEDRIPLVNIYRKSESPSGNRSLSPCSYGSGSRTPTPGNSRPGSPVPQTTSKHNHSIQDLLKLIGKKVSGRKTKDLPLPNNDVRRTSCFLEVPKDSSQFRGRSKSLDDGTARKQSPNVDSATAYKIYDQILKEGNVVFLYLDLAVPKNKIFDEYFLFLETV